MWRDLLLRAAKLVCGILAAIALAALLAALSSHAHGMGPFGSAFGTRLLTALKGDFGASATSGRSAIASVENAFPATLTLMGLGAVFATFVGVPLGAALGASRILRAFGPLMELFAATPVFVASLALIWIAHHVSPGNALTTGRGSDSIQALILPAVVVGIVGAGTVQLALRRGAAKAATAPYREGLRIMGLNALDIGVRYVAPEIAAALVRELGQITLTLLSASIVVEWVFPHKGVAELLLISVRSADWNVVAATLLFFAVIVLAADFIGGCLAQFISPEEQD